LLGYALQSALEQTFEDYEIVVSNNFSLDSTRQVVEELMHTRVRYVNTGKPLPIHDSWEFALGHASGDYVVFLGDDDALHLGLLSMLSSLVAQHPADIVCWQRCQYFHPGYPLAGLANTLEIPLFSNTLHTVQSAKELSSLFRLRHTGGQPKLFNSICSRALLQKIHKAIGRFFLPPNAPYTSCVLQLASTSEYILLDYPLSIAGHAPESSCDAILSQSENLRSILEEFQDPVFEKVPLKGMTATNLLAESLLRAAGAFSPKLKEYNLDWKRYFMSYYNELSRMGDRGADVAEQRKEFWHVVSEQSITFRLKLLSKMMLHQVKGKVKARSRSMRALPIIRGERKGFSNIYECARSLEQLLLPAPLF